MVAARRRRRIAISPIGQMAIFYRRKTDTWLFKFDQRPYRGFDDAVPHAENSRVPTGFRFGGDGPRRRRRPPLEPCLYDLVRAPAGDPRARRARRPHAQGLRNQPLRDRSGRPWPRRGGVAAISATTRLSRGGSA